MTINRFLWLATTTLFAATGALAGWALGGLYTSLKSGESFVVAPATQPIVITTMSIATAFVMARIGASFGHRVVAAFARIHEMSVAERVLGIIGLLLGLLFGFLVTSPLTLPASINQLWIVPLVKSCILAVSAMLGMALFQGMRSEMLRVFPALDHDADTKPTLSTIKFLDTNVIIDGRIADLCRTGFIEGPVFVPFFVLNELQYIADSADSMRRARGRRGLETLNAMREIMLPGAPGEEPRSAVEVISDISSAVAHIETVDAKLVALAKEKSGAILTNDYNLNRVAELQGVKVLNLNQLALALKPVVLPGEEMTLSVVREGKEAGQGIGYLEDGTMVVVNEGRAAIGETCVVIIAQVLQTVAGKMIFADLKEREVRAELREPPGPRGAGDDLFDEDKGSDDAPRHHNSDRASGGMRRKNRT